VPIVKEWIDGDLNDVTTLPDGKRFVLDAKTLLRWEHAASVASVYEGFPDEAGGGFKETIQLDAAPAVARWRFRLTFPAGLQFHLQPPLTPEEIAFGDSRPDWCVGSFAVTDPWGCKVFHIPRPLAADSDGKKQWFDLSLENGRDLVITGDADWLKSAKFPVLIDPTFGYTTIGVSNSNGTQDYLYGVGPYAPASSGNCTTIHIYTVTSQSMAAGIYPWAPSGQSLLGDTDEVVTPAGGWATFTCDSPIAITNGTNYTLGQNHSVGNANFRFDAVGGFSLWYKSGVAHVSGTLADPFSSTPTEVAGRKYSFYGTYTESAGNPWYYYAQQAG
jgi:hypothetical protein